MNTITTIPSDAEIMIMYCSNISKNGEELLKFLESNQNKDSETHLLLYAIVCENFEIIKIVRNFCKSQKSEHDKVSTEYFHEIVVSKSIDAELLIKILEFEPPENIYDFVNLCFDKCYNISTNLEKYIRNKIDETTYPTDSTFLSNIFEKIIFFDNDYIKFFKKITARGVRLYKKYHCDESVNDLEYLYFFINEKYIEAIGYENHQQIFEILHNITYLVDISGKKTCDMHIFDHYLRIVHENAINPDIILYLYNLIFSYNIDDDNLIKRLGTLMINIYCKSYSYGPNLQFLKILAKYKIIEPKHYITKEKCLDIPDKLNECLNLLNRRTILEIVTYVEDSLREEISALKTEIQLRPDSDFVKKLGIDFKNKIEK